MCCILESLAHIATILAGIGTIGTFCKLIYDSKIKGKQIEAMQRIESRQLDVLYTPDIRANSWGIIPNRGTTIDIMNNGDNLIIQNIIDNSDVKIVNTERIQTWFPLHFDKGEIVKIPLLKSIGEFSRNCQFRIVVTNKMQQKYSCSVLINGSNVKIMPPIKEISD